MALPEDTLAYARELLPWYVNGTLDERERSLVEEQLARSAALREELDWLRRLDRDLDETVHVPSGDLGLARLMTRIEAQRAGQVVPLRRKERPRWFAPALALAASLLIAQTLVIGVLLSEREGVLRPASGPAQAQGALLQVQFRADATEVQIRRLLLEIGGEIVGGPGSLGIYTVRVPAQEAETALLRLRGETGLVEAVNTIPR
jgi:anti-sigma factor RsiW